MFDKRRHLDDNAVVDVLTDTVPKSRMRELHSHLFVCRDCRTLVRACAALLSPRSSDQAT